MDSKVIEFPGQNYALDGTRAVSFADTGVVLNREPTTDELVALWQQVQYVTQRSPWYVGDLLLLLEERFEHGEEMQWVSETFGLQTLRNYKSVAKRVPITMRHSPDELSYSAHARLAPLPDEDRAHWIDVAAERSWNSDDCGVAYREIQRCYRDHVAIDDEAICALVENDGYVFDEQGPVLTMADQEAEQAKTKPPAARLVDPGPPPDYADVTFNALQLRMVLKVLRHDSTAEGAEPDERDALYEIQSEMELALQELEEALAEHAERLKAYFEQETGGGDA